ncbi:MAG: Gfo/Idh/MocA family oxidoreductase [Coxiellaceae bacterium]|nr:Gfo/Idh/MocA family oxidoreductase [Coxiellaceae bacterium]
MNKIKTAVIGVGYLGQYHAEKYALLPQSELIAVCDTDIERCALIAEKYDTQAVNDYTQLAEKVDAVSIVVPTPYHFEVAKFFIENGVHVLIEKPITTTIEQADQLIKLAKMNNAMIQVGHIERFNNAIKALDNYLSEPRFIESVRLAPFKLRGSDVNVILDVMIHDIDIIQSFVKSNIRDISASGASVLTPYIDIINARIEFENGCVASVTASRVSLKTERTLRIFQHDCYIGLNLDRKSISIHRKGTKEMFPGIPEITREKHQFEKGDALKDQINAFLNAIINQVPPVVSGEDGKKALEIAIEITQKVHDYNEQYPLTAHG